MLEWGWFPLEHARPVGLLSWVIHVNILRLRNAWARFVSEQFALRTLRWNILAPSLLIFKSLWFGFSVVIYLMTTSLFIHRIRARNPHMWNTILASEGRDLNCNISVHAFLDHGAINDTRSFIACKLDWRQQACKTNYTIVVENMLISHM